MIKNIQYSFTFQCECVFNKDKKMTYSCSYMPQMEGEYRVIVKWSEKEIAKSPYKVLVEGAAGDPSKVTAKGPGLEKTGVIVGKKTHFEVFTKGMKSCLDRSGNKFSCFKFLQFSVLRYS